MTKNAMKGTLVAIGATALLVYLLQSPAVHSVIELFNIISPH